MIREIFRKAQLFLMLALGTYPVFALICAFFAPGVLGSLWLFGLIFIAAGFLLLLLPKKLKYVVWALACAAFFLLASQLEGGTIWYIFAACYCGLLFWYLQIRDWGSGQEIPGGWMALWLGALILACVLSYNVQQLAPAALILRAGLFIYVFLGMCSINRSTLYMASGGKNCITARMRRNNLLLVLGMFGIALVASLFSTQAKLLIALLAFLQSLRGWGSTEPTETEEVIETIATTVTETLETVAGGVGGATEGVEELPPIPQTPNWLIGFYIFAAAIGAFFVVVVIVAKRVNKTKKDKTSIHTGVEDEITSILKEERDSEKLKRQKKEEPSGWLSPTMRIRRRYKALADKNPQWGKSSTARENLREEAAKIYEKTRYSSHAVTKQDAEDFKNKTK